MTIPKAAMKAVWCHSRKAMLRMPRISKQDPNQSANAAVDGHKHMDDASQDLQKQVNRK